MRILYVSQYFPPEMGAPSARVDELSREWARRGQEVTVLTGFAHHPIGRKAARDRRRLTRRERTDGVEVVRAYVYAAPNRGIVRRMISYASFMVSAIVVGLVRVPRPEVVVATSPQLLCACAGYVLARAFRVPFVFEVRDLWPESILAVDAMRDNPVVRGLRRVARHLYLRSDCIVTVGAGYRRQIHARYGIPMEKMREIPNGIPTALFVPGPKHNEVRREYGWGERFVLMYVGTHGMAHALHGLLEVAAMLRDDPSKLFVFVGEGAEKDRLKRLARERRLDNVQFIDQQPKARVPLYYAACDAGLVTLRDTPLFQEVLPSKIFEYLAMERPILLSVGGQARELVEASGGGLYVPPEDAPAMVEAIRRLAAAGEEELARMGRAGRAFVVAGYARREQAARYLDLLGTLGGERGT
ncbi:MAG: glycosyltransferase family 4 protein [bacterium]|nr:glycosyltransferase family 4 protein [bacterium]